MPNSQTPNSRAARARCATAANHAKLAAGWKRLNILISPQASEALDRLIQVHETKTAAVEAALKGEEMKVSDKEIIDWLEFRLWSLHLTQAWPPKRLEFADNYGVKRLIEGSDIRKMVKEANSQLS